MTAIFGKGYFCSCQDRDECNEFCPVYRARLGMSDLNNMVQVSEKEYEKMSKAMLITRYLIDFSRMIDEIKEEVNYG